MIDAIRSGLADLADPAKAPDMQAYMKSDMPFYGVQKPARAKLARSVFDAHPLDGFDAWQHTIQTLWRDATHREERYMALALLQDRRDVEAARIDHRPGPAQARHRPLRPHELSPLSRREALKNVTP